MKVDMKVLLGLKKTIRLSRKKRLSNGESESL